jgi:DNA polymerase-3 subunit epsilon
MKIIFCDSESTGLISDYKVSTSEFEKFPCLAELAFSLVDHETKEVIESECHIIKPDGWEIPVEASNIHGITTERADAEGSPLREVLEKCQAMQSKADFFVAWNASFDGKLVRAACCRVGMSPDISKMPTIDPMHISTNYFKIPFPSGRKGNKFPKLTEAYLALFGKAMEGAHSAGTDVKGMIECFFELEKRKVICHSHYEEAIKIQRENKE